MCECVCALHARTRTQRKCLSPGLDAIMKRLTHPEGCWAVQVPSSDTAHLTWSQPQLPSSKPALALALTQPSPAQPLPSLSHLRSLAWLTRFFMCLLVGMVRLDRLEVCVRVCVCLCVLVCVGQWGRRRVFLMEGD